MNENNKIKLQLDLDEEQLEAKMDVMNKKAEKLVSLLKEANSLLDELTSKRS